MIFESVTHLEQWLSRLWVRAVIDLPIIEMSSTTRAATVVRTYVGEKEHLCTRLYKVNSRVVFSTMRFQDSDTRRGTTLFSRVMTCQRGVEREVTNF
jgi:hypothetical protein